MKEADIGITIFQMKYGKNSDLIYLAGKEAGEVSPKIIDNL